VVRWLCRNAIPEEGLWANAYPGTRLLLHPRDWIEHLLLRGERYEPLTLGFLTANLRAGDAAVLAGVNFGLHVVVAARAVGESGRVIGIEPQPAALLRTRQNLEANGIEGRALLVECALGSATGFVPMAWSSPANAGAASLLDPGPGFGVCVVPLPHVLGCESAPRLLLLDVQGYETEVLAGISNGWRPDLVVVESDPEFLERAGVTEPDLLRSISDLGYQLHDLHGSPVTVTSTGFVERNIIGVRPGATVNWIAAEEGR